jgi:hypothetical protein
MPDGGDLVQLGAYRYRFVMYSTYLHKYLDETVLALTECFFNSELSHNCEGALDVMGF